jgi:hypothetical protein
LLVADTKQCADCRDLVACELHAAEIAIHVAEGVDASDGLLAEVAAFGEVDGERIAGKFLRQIRRRDVAAKQRRAVLNAGGLNRVVANSLRADGFERGLNLVRVDVLANDEIAIRGNEIDAAHCYGKPRDRRFMMIEPLSRRFAAEQLAK